MELTPCPPNPHQLAKDKTQAAFDKCIDNVASVSPITALVLANIGPGIAAMFGAPNTAERRDFLAFIEAAETEFATFQMLKD